MNRGDSEYIVLKPAYDQFGTQVGFWTEGFDFKYTAVNIAFGYQKQKNALLLGFLVGKKTKGTLVVPYLKLTRNIGGF